jgi:hypothetical protein
MSAHPPQASDRALFAVRNLCGNSRFCATFSLSDELGRRLLERQDGPRPAGTSTCPCGNGSQPDVGGGARRDDSDRAVVAMLSASRLGTRTWRQLDRI